MHVRPRTTAVWILIVGVLGFTPASLGQITLHVDPSASDTPHDGSSWCRAYTDLQDALAASQPGDEVLVAAGTYKPTTGTTRIKTFQLVSGVSILGGFAGCGALDPHLRDFNAYPSILSGDLLGNDDPTPSSSCCTDNGTQTCDDAVCVTDVCAERPSCCADVWDEICGAVARVVCCSTCGNTCENSYHVVTGSGADATAVLDGFIITQGHADGNNPSDRGAGIFSFFVASNPSIRNCIIRGNTAIGKGAGMYNDLSGVTLESCLFTHNAAPNGAAIFNFRSAPLISNCTISENIAFVNQGGVRNATNDSPTIYNAILWGNLDAGGRDEPAQLNVGSGTNLTLDYSCIQGLTGLFGGTGNTGENPLFTDPDGADNRPGTPDDDFRLVSTSPMIEAGDPGFVPPANTVDLDGQPRFQGCGVDIGAYEFPLQGRDCDSDGDGTPDSEDACPNNPNFAADPGPCNCSSADGDGDGTLDCVDVCPNDPNKVDPGACGCGVDDNADADGDGVADCIDQCNGVDDAVFAPECAGLIPTVSEWGLVILSLLLLVTGKVYFGRGRTIV